MSLGRDVAGVFVRNVLVFVLAVGNSILLTRTLGVTGKGEYALFTASVGFLSLFLGMGLENAIRFHVSRDELPRERILGFALTVVVGATLVVFGAARANHALFTNELLLPAARQNPVFELVLAATVGTTLLYSLLVAVFAGTRAFTVLNWASLGTSAFSLAVYAALFWLDVGGRAIGSAEIFVAYLSLQALAALVLGALGVRLLDLRLAGLLVPPGLLGRMLRYAGRSYMAQLAQFLNYRVDIWLVQLFVGTRGLGFYSLSANLAMMLWVLPRSTSSVLMPSMATGDGEVGFDEAARLGRVVLWGILALAVPLALTAHLWIGLLYGAEFRPAALPFGLLLVGAAPFSLCIVQASALAAVDRLEVNLAGSLVGLVVTVVLDLLLIPRWGIAGAALASSLSYLVTLAIVLRAFTRIGGVSLRRCLILERDDLRRILDGVRGARP